MAETHTSPTSLATQTTDQTPNYLNFQDLNNPYRIDHADNPALGLVPELLTTDNYISWSRAMFRALRAKNKVGFIDGTFLKPSDTSDPLYTSWERCNNIVVSWIANSVDPCVKRSLSLMDDAAKIWVDLKNRYSQHNLPRVFQLKRALSNLCQGEYSVTAYYGKLKMIWDELIIYEPTPECTCGQVKTFLNRYERDCVIQFLMGLNETFTISRDQIMLLDPLPPVNKLFSMIQQQEAQRKISSSNQTAENMAFAVKSVNQRGNVGGRGSKYCTHCKIIVLKILLCSM